MDKSMLKKMKSMIQEDTILVSVCSVDSELGIRQPIEEIGEVLKDYKYCFFIVMLLKQLVK